MEKGETEMWIRYIKAQTLLAKMQYDKLWFKTDPYMRDLFNKVNSVEYRFFIDMIRNEWDETE